MYHLFSCLGQDFYFRLNKDDGMHRLVFFLYTCSGAALRAQMCLCCWLRESVKKEKGENRDKMAD